MKTNVDVRGSWDIFARCQTCGQMWPDRDSFLKDPKVMLSGYMPNFRESGAGSFLFIHEVCKAKFSVLISEFMDMYEGEFYDESLYGLPSCPDYCGNPVRTNTCPKHCEHACIRAVMQTVMNWPKEW